MSAQTIRAFPIYWIAKMLRCALPENAPRRKLQTDKLQMRALKQLCLLLQKEYLTFRWIKAKLLDLAQRAWWNTSQRARRRTSVHLLTKQLFRQQQYLGGLPFVGHGIARLKSLMSWGDYSRFWAEMRYFPLEAALTLGETHHGFKMAKARKIEEFDG